MKIRQGDRLPTHKARAFDEDGFVDLTQFVSIAFKMVSGATIVTGAATGDATGHLEYAWAANDTDVEGEYEAVYIGTDAQGRTQTFPTETNLRVTVVPAI